MKGAISTEVLLLFVGFLLASLIATLFVTQSMERSVSTAADISNTVSSKISNNAEVVSAFYLGEKTYVLLKGVSGAIPMEKVTLLVDGAPQSFEFRKYRGDSDTVLERGELFYIILPYRVGKSTLSLHSSSVSSYLGVLSDIYEFYFPFRVKITVDNRSGLTPSDYPLRVELNASNFNMTHVTTPDCSDILPVDANGKIMKYYTEECSDSRIVLWVRLPILEREVNFYILYGRGGLPSESNAFEVFNFYEDAEVFSGWVQYSNGEVKHYCTESYEGRCSLLKTTGNDPSGGYKYFSQSIERNFVLEVWIKRLNLSGGTCDRLGVIDSSGNGYGFLYCHSSGIGLGIDKRNGYVPTILVSSDAGTDVVGDWFKAVLIVYGDEINAEYYYQGVLQDRVSATDTSYTSFSSFYIFGGYDYLVDKVILRKVVYPEPTVILGPEEEGTFVPQ